MAFRILIYLLIMSYNALFFFVFLHTGTHNYSILASLLATSPWNIICSVNFKDESSAFH